MKGIQIQGSRIRHPRSVEGEEQRVPDRRFLADGKQKNERQRQEDGGARQRGAHWYRFRRPMQPRNEGPEMSPFNARIAALALLFAALPAGAQEGEFFEQIDVDVVNVEVFVTDRRGDPVTGLEQEDFELLVDGQPVAITNFYAETRGRPFALPAPPPEARSPAPRGALQPLPEPDDQRLHLAVFIDNLNLHPTNRKRAFRHLREFLATRLSPEDVVTMVSFNRSLWIHNDFVADRRMLENVLAEVEGMAAADFAAANERRRIFRDLAEARNSRADDVTYRAPILAQIRAYAQERFNKGLTSTQALGNLLQTLAGIPGRKALLHLSDGIATRPGEGMYESWSALFGSFNNQYERDVGAFDLLPEFRELGRIANASRVTFYALDAVSDHRSIGRSAELQGSLDGGTLSNFQLELMDSNAREPLELTSITTGGRRIQMSSEIGTELGRIAADFATFYSLGFRSPGGEPRDRRIEVKVRRPGLRLRHRETFRPKARDKRSGDATLAALLYNTGSNRLGVVLEPGGIERRDDGSSILTVLIKVPIGKLVLLPRGAAHAAQVSFFVSVRDKAGGARPVQKLPFHLNIPADKVAEARGREAVYRLPLLLRPGDLQAVVGVRDDFAAEESAVRLELGRWSGG